MFDGVIFLGFLQWTGLAYLPHKGRQWRGGRRGGSGGRGGGGGVACGLTMGLRRKDEGGEVGVGEG